MNNKQIDDVEFHSLDKEKPQISTIRSETLYHRLQKQKLIGIILLSIAIILILSAIIIPTTLVLMKKNNDKDISTTAMSVEATTTEILSITTETTETTAFTSTAVEITTTEVITYSSWNENGTTIAGGNGEGNKLNQLNQPYGIYIDDDDDTVYIADHSNHRIVRWISNATFGEVVAGGNRAGNGINQLNNPSDMVIDKRNDSLIVCDKGNKRMMRYSLKNPRSQEILISSISCWGLALDGSGDLYITDRAKGEVRRWREGESNEKIVAGGNGHGSNRNQLRRPTYIFVDANYSVYVSDGDNSRIMKWSKDATAGIIVAVCGYGGSCKIFFTPAGVIVDDKSNVYVAASDVNQITRWSQKIHEVVLIVGTEEKGAGPNQFWGPCDMSFDRHGNIYVVDIFNHRVQKFYLENRN